MALSVASVGEGLLPDVLSLSERWGCTFPPFGMALPLLAGTFHLDEARFSDSRATDRLRLGRPFFMWDRGNSHRPVSPCRFVQGFDDPYILQPFLTRWFRLAVFQDAIGEV